MAPKYAKGWGVTRGTLMEWSYLLLGRKLYQNWMWVVKVEARGEGRHPCGTYLPTEEYVYLCPLSFGEGEVVPVK